jgi:hypothetical protein
MINFLGKSINLSYQSVDSLYVGHGFCFDDHNKLISKNSYINSND